MRSIDQNMSNFAAQFPFRYEAWVFLGEQIIDFCPEQRLSEGTEWRGGKGLGVLTEYYSMCRVSVSRDGSFVFVKSEEFQESWTTQVSKIQFMNNWWIHWDT